jgi:O-antigen/teichoic acid export membrane protein
MANVGCYARNTGSQALAVNLAAAGVALAGYAVLIPRMGVEGAIVATVMSQGVRFVIFAMLSQRSAPLDWRVAPLGALSGLVLVAVMIGGVSGGAVLTLAAGLAVVLKLAPLPNARRLAAA